MYIPRGVTTSLLLMRKAANLSMGEPELAE